MSYLTYNEEFQGSVTTDKYNGMIVKDICLKYNISVYTLYKILHFNNKRPIPSQTTGGEGSVGGVERRDLSPNNNNLQERPSSTWWYNSDRHSKIKHECLNCNNVFYARDRAARTKYCSRVCKDKHNKFINSTILVCDNCGTEFRIKNSQVNSCIRCSSCRKLKLWAPSSKMSRLLGEWLSSKFKVEKEKQFDWLFDKPKGRLKIDYFLVDFNIGIEYDGEQHFKPSFTGKWETVDKVQRRDKLKDKMCSDKGIKIIRFRYDEKLDKESVLMKIYAELQGNELVEVEDKKPLR